MSNLIVPTLYLDIDGVLIPYDPLRSPFSTKELSRYEQYAPEVVERLGKTCLNLVWCSTWSQPQIKNMTEQMNALKHGEYLPIPTPPTKTTWISQKLKAVSKHQQTTPAPFIWIDDDITEVEVNKINEQFCDVPYLLIAPSRITGINEQELSLVESFALQPPPAA